MMFDVPKEKQIYCEQNCLWNYGKIWIYKLHIFKSTLFGPPGFTSIV